MTVYALPADISANPNKNVVLYQPGQTQFKPGDVFLGGTGTGVTDDMLGPNVTRISGNTAQDTANAYGDYNGNLASQIRNAMYGNMATRPDYYKGMASVARRSMETQQAQDKINNAMNDAKLTGYLNNAPTLAQKVYNQNVNQDNFNNGIKVGDLMGVYNGSPTLAKQAQAIQQAQFNAKLAQNASQFDRSLESSDANAAANRAGKVSGNVKSWLTAALQATGQSIDMLPYLETIVQHESGGDPTAVNNWDSNAKAGHPSKGLMQTIDSTFNQYKMDGHDDIFNPVDNAIAGIRYAIARYGSLANVPGIKSMSKGGGYVGY